MSGQERLDRDFLAALGLDYNSMSDEQREVQLFSLPFYDVRREQINRFKAYVILQDKINKDNYTRHTLSSMERRYVHVKMPYLKKIKREILKSVA